MTDRSKWEAVASAYPDKRRGLSGIEYFKNNEVNKRKTNKEINKNKTKLTINHE